MTSHAPQDSQQAAIERAVKDSRLSLLGQMTAGLAHEIKNPLAVIRLKMDMISSDLVDLPKVLSTKFSGHLALIEKNIEKIIAITNQIRNLSHTPDDKFHSIDLHEILTGVVKMQRSFAKNRNAEITVKTEANPSAFYGNRNQIEQVFLSLLQNSYEAFELYGQGSQVMIHTESNNKHIVITFSDDGIGIPPENRSKIFEPFFTTKELGGGSGLGLTMVEKLLHNHGGTIELLKSKKPGAHFKIMIPNDRRHDRPSDSQGVS